MSEQPTRTVVDDVHDALAEALMRHERAMLGPWVLVAQTTTEDGVRGVWTVESQGIMRYEAFGLLNHSLASVQASYLLDEDEDEP